MKNVFPLKNDVNRPIIEMDELFQGCTALIDTGAVIPVWTKNAELLKELSQRENAVNTVTFG